MPAIQIDERNRTQALVVAAAQQMPDVLEVHQLASDPRRFFVLVTEAFMKVGVETIRKAFERRWLTINTMPRFTQDKKLSKEEELSSMWVPFIGFHTVLPGDLLTHTLWWRSELNEDDKLVIEHLYQIPTLMQIIRQRIDDDQDQVGLIRYLCLLEPGSRYMDQVGLVKDAWEELSTTAKGKDRPWRWLCSAFHPTLPFTKGVEVVRNIRPKYRFLYGPTAPLHTMIIENKAWDDADVIAFSMPAITAWRDELVRKGEKMEGLVGFVFDLDDPSAPASLRESQRGRALIEAAKQTKVQPFMTGVVAKADIIELLEKSENEKHGNLIVLASEASRRRTHLLEVLDSLPHEPTRLPIVVAFKGALSLHAMPVSAVVAALTN